MKYLNKTTKLFISIFILLLAISCKDKVPFDKVYSFWVENKSDKGIVFLVSSNYPDTLIPDTYNKIRGVAAATKAPFDSHDKWEEVFDNLPADTLSVFIFSSDTLQQYDWQTIRNCYNILKRYDLSIYDLEAMNWIITYP